MLIGNTMAKLMFAIVIGYYLNKKDIMNTEVNSKVSSIIIQIACPCLIIGSVSSMVGGSKGDALYLLMIGVLIYIAVPILSWVITGVLPIKKNKKTIQCMLMFSNCGFMALPIVQSIFGNDAIFYNTLLHMPYNLLFFTFGAYLLAKDGEGDYKFEAKRLLSVGVISSLAAIVIYFGNIQLPSFVTESCSFIGTIVTPLSMISIGSSIADYPIKEIISDKKLYIISFLRLIIIPVLTYVILSLFVENQMIVQMATITLGMPVGSMVAMGANEYHGDVRMAAFGVALSTILSIATIPVMLMLLGV